MFSTTGLGHDCRRSPRRLMIFARYTCCLHKLPLPAMSLSRPTRDHLPRHREFKSRRDEALYLLLVTNLAWEDGPASATSSAGHLQVRGRTRHHTLGPGAPGQLVNDAPGACAANAVLAAARKPLRSSPWLGRGRGVCRRIRIELAGHTGGGVALRT